MSHSKDTTVKLDPWVHRFVTSPHRFNWVNYSRQLGKSTGLVIRRAYRGITRKRLQIMVSASERQAAELSLKARQILEACQIIGPKDKSSVTEIRTDDLRMVFVPPNERTIRGYTGDVGWDEVAMTRDSRQLWAAMYPMITRINGEIDVCSTPKGCADQFYKLKDNQYFNHLTCTLDDAIAEGCRLDRDEIYATYDDDEYFRQEYLCEFLDEESAYLTYDQIRKCFDPGLPVENEGPAYIPDDAELYIGVDLGRKRDLTVIWICRRIGQILKTVCIITLHKTPFTEQTRILYKWLSDARVVRCCIDATYNPQLAEQAEEQFGPIVEGVNFTQHSKGLMASQLRSRVQNCWIHIPVCDRIARDWHGVKKDVTAQGGIRLSADHTDDGHSDRFWAGALCCHAAGSVGKHVESEEYGLVI